MPWTTALSSGSDEDPFGWMYRVFYRALLFSYYVLMGPVVGDSGCIYPVEDCWEAEEQKEENKK